MTTLPAPGIALASHLIAVLDSLAECLCTAVNANQATCFCGVLPGAQVALDYAGCYEDGCQNGMGWVRLAGMYSATVTGQPSLTPGNCSVGTGVDIEMGVIRCAPQPADDGTPPSVVDQSDSSVLQVLDAAAVRAAVLCCDALNLKDTIVSGWVPIGPEGAVVGGRLTLSTIIYA